MNRKSNKLFHVLVVVGSSMTGAGVACGGHSASILDVDPNAARDAAADGKGSDAAYRPDGAYPTIGYPMISPAPDPCTQRPSFCAGDAGPSDASDASDAIYPGIRPAGDF